MDIENKDIQSSGGGGYNIKKKIVKNVIYLQKKKKKLEIMNLSLFLLSLFLSIALDIVANIVANEKEKFKSLLRNNRLRSRYGSNIWFE